MKQLSRIYLLLLLLFLSVTSSVHAAEATEMQGSSVPTGTITITSDGSYNNKTPEKTIDQDLTTDWNAGKYNASLELRFPQSTYLNFVQLAVFAHPQATNTYTIFGLKNGNWTAISSPTSLSLSNKVTVMDPILVTEGVYDGIRIDAKSSASWISIFEITIGTQEKPGQPDIEEPTPEEPGHGNPEPSGNRAILVVTMTTGLEKEFDLSMKEVNGFIDWYEAKQAGSGKASYAINKHDNNKGPFSSRKDYMLFDRILTFEVSEYSK
ncbi:hypothetical protein [Paenibacillus kribbensis]|uniref:hypothetical protein n=1 Tax=Paenibacillus kribbensis TaxID=172713 RepID=UPI0008396A86|nr:hypothetical protein [Paenibacillus kribbensis]